MECKMSAIKAEKQSIKLCSLIEDWDDDSNIKSLKKLIESGADINFQNDLWEYNSPLHLAVVKNNVDLIKFLLENGADKTLRNDSKKTPEEIAEESGNRMIIELVSKKTIANKEIAEKPEYMSDFKVLHDTIKSGTQGNVADCIEELKLDNLDTKICYDQQHNSALKVALLNQKFDTFAYLKSMNFVFGDDESSYELKQIVLTEDPKALVKLRQENLRFLHAPYILNLMSMTKISNFSSEKDRNEKYELVRSWYDELHEVDNLALILRIISKAKDIKIFVDFKRIRDLDPTLSEMTFGTTYFDDRNVLIDGNRGRYEILGTLIHEFTHFALYIVYQNNGRPYFSHDKESIKKLDDIVEKYSKAEYISKEIIVERVYGYSKETRHQEIIVRPPHIYATYKNLPDKINELEETFHDLFEFFRTKVIPDLERFSSIQEVKQATKDLNKTLDVSSLIEAFKFDCNSNMVEVAKKYQAPIVSQKYVIHSNMPIFLTKLIFKQLQTIQNESTMSMNLFMKFSNLLNSNYLKTITSIGKEREKPTIFILCESTCQPDVNKNVHKYLEIFQDQNFHVTFMFHESIDASKIVGHSLYQVHDPFIFYWRDLLPKSQKKVLEEEIRFQDRKLTFNGIIQPESVILQEMKLDEILETKLLFKKSYESNENSCLKTSFHISRNFEINDEKGLIERKHFEEMDLLHFAEEKDVILSDVAGMGKTSALLQFKSLLEKQYPNYLHFFVQLQKVSSLFIPDKDIDETFFFGISRLFDILRINDNFEKKLFVELFNDRKVVLMFDGFDEISPNYPEFVMKLLKFCQNKARLWVSTRLHLAKELEKKLGCHSFQINPFNNEDKTNFLVHFWDSDRKQPHISFENLQKTAEKFVSKLSSAVNYKSFSTLIGIPLQIRMFAEIFKENLDASLTDFINNKNEIEIFEFYESFIKKKLSIRKDKGSIAIEEEIQLEMEQINLIQCHCNKALLQILSSDQIALLSITESSQQSLMPETIFRLGILCKSNENNFTFIHQTFAEFFVSRFLLNSFYNDNEIELEKNLKIFVDLISQKDYQVIRNFLNTGLKPEKLSSKFLNILTDVMKNVTFRKKKLLEYLVIENHTKLLKILLENARKDHNLQKEILIGDEDEILSSLIHIATLSSSVEVIQMLLTEIASDQSDSCDEILTRITGEIMSVGRFNINHAKSSDLTERFKQIVNICKITFGDKYKHPFDLCVAAVHSEGEMGFFEEIWGPYHKFFGLSIFRRKT